MSSPRSYHPNEMMNGPVVTPVASQELETFISQEENGNQKIVRKYTMSKDIESEDYDPFAERRLPSPTSNMDTLTHLLKASLGTGILAMPKAFECAGLVNGIIFTILVAFVCTHCSYILVKCAHVLYRKSKKPSMTFAEVGQAALENGPEKLKSYALAFRYFITVSLFVTYFGTCSVYTVIVAKNVLKVTSMYINVSPEDTNVTRIFILLLLVPLILLSWVRNLKYLAPVSMIANVFMGFGLGVTIYFLVGTGKLQLDNVTEMLFKPIWDWPQFFSLSIFAMEAIGVVMPLENSMKTPRAMLGTCGVLNKGMSGVALVYIFLGFFGYLRFGSEVESQITLNLDGEDKLAQAVNIAIAIAVYCTFGLQFYVCIEIMWNEIKDKFTKRPDLADYIMRTVMVTVCVLIAVAVPQIKPLIGVIGAFCFSLLGLIAPAVIEVITYWDIGFGPFKYLIWKNILILIFGMFALVFGTKVAVEEIIAAN